LVAEVESLAAAGVVEVTLLGQNVNSYGRDITLALRRQIAAGSAPAGDPLPPAPAWRAGRTWVAEGARRARPLFGDLLRAVGQVPGIRRVRFTSPHPKDLRPETIEAMASEPAVCEQLHLPLQAGSDAVLARMHRGYTSARYLERLAAARAAKQGRGPRVRAAAPATSRKGPAVTGQPTGDRALRSPASEKQRAGTLAMGARRQAKRDSR
ncbi:MAG: radical SAM protein, partial [Streptosporangiaceae bacterium]